MADGFDITPQTLATAAAALDGPTADLRTQVSDIRSTVGSGNPWGSDEQGSIFGGLYTQVLTHAIDTLTSHADLLQYAAENLSGWGETHSSNDQQVQAKFTALGGS